MEIRVIASVVAKTEFIEEVKAALHQIIEPSREEKGNLQYDLHTESEQKGSFVFFERWASDEALEKHNKTEHFKQLVKAIDGKLESLDIKKVKQIA
ncbi:antibiotic biosynthesis monooxygenase [Yersinia pseudotuberculosis]|uniref:Antibiotic biosynthesis monooxygenase domain-containing protein n=3 Tax=Yersinia pseudotuberculosis complex TaxID=1649845 RepID=A0A0T9JLK2_YERPU|nr:MULTISPECIES: putative quinol monooxygenase [Yersinia pseudotuberculosis complex]PSH19934.1 antibiotic biosynthesis monooxygenase [Yersinia pseudotuberculosis]CNC97171.1 antibiotic biosynthesis monooxygenase domain-containing protein [Yersinia pseudotuberculosis]CRG51370.1 antibiotic biosynthesis monooxygenase domain-containing protein [Yersinia wautersii]SUP83909.1 antibiotic biosynthesis monooxygenase domain-containing protein [Yersinia pseudotuberculosis]